MFLDKNGELIDYFRDLIWRLKGCWTKERKIANAVPPDQEADRMWRIRDFGILFYKDVPEKSPRNYLALELGEALRFNWSQEDGGLLDGVKRDPTTEPSYTYHYYDRQGRDGSHRLVSSWSVSTSGDRWLRFSKRTDRPLFTISEPDKQTFQRYELVPIRVRMDRGLDFTPDQFELSFALRKTGDAKTEKPLKGPLPLGIEPVSSEFQLDVDLSDLRPEEREYSLAVTAKGRHARSGPCAQQERLPQRLQPGTVTQKHPGLTIN